MQMVGVVWLLGVCIGHTAIWTLSVNCWYSFALPRRFLSCLRYAHGGFVVLGLMMFAWAYFDASSLADTLSFGFVAQTAAQAYGLVCCLVGLVYMPLLTLWRLCRRQPAVLLSNHIKTVDIGQREVENDAIEALARMARDAELALGRNHDVKARLAEIALHHLGKTRVIFNKQDAAGHKANSNACPA